ncbi:hypothetical protein [Nocardia sp. NPDC003963]
MLSRAHSEADRIVDSARIAARNEKARADTAAVEIARRATEIGRARAAERLAAARRDAARRRRDRVLLAQRAAYDRWQDAATAAVLRIRTEPGYPEVLAGLRAFAVRTLGTEVRIAEDPAGGLVARAGSRILDLRLTTIATHALQRTRPGVDGLWT